MDYFFKKSLLSLLQSCLCFTFQFFGHKACGILTPQPGTQAAAPALEGEVLTTSPPGKSQQMSKSYLSVKSANKPDEKSRTFVIVTYVFLSH